ncbi:HAD family hydrolase [Ramlibacter sp. MMS24-I3-19]|uniref:HAD family hydrolase n=1 Tax=Ramlibacter sp. MMS24-I3-19 TaxID=3416606 RepID=UPI003D0724C8
MSSRPRIALFDLDNTLLPIDSDYSWGEFTQTIGWTDPVVFKQRNDAFYEHYKAGTLDVHDYVRFATEAIRLRGRGEALQARERFMREVIAPAILEPAKALLDAHRQAGDRLVIVTATNEFVTRPIAQAFGVQELVAVQLATDADGWITGEIDGVPSMREGKVVRVADWLRSQGLDWGDVDTTFYSDSTNDLPLLQLVDHPVATNPDARLRVIAQQHGWRILDLFPSHP